MVMAIVVISPCFLSPWQKAQGLTPLLSSPQAANLIIFDPALTSFSQFDSVLAIVHLNGKTIYLDPGTRYCPYGLLRSMSAGTAFMDMETAGDMADTPDSREVKTP